MVTPEEIAQAMAVYSADDEPRHAHDDDEPRQVLVDDKPADATPPDGEARPG